MTLIGGKIVSTPCQAGRRHHRRRHPRQSETPAHVAGFFMRDTKPEQLFAFAGTLLILNGFIGSGLGATRPPLYIKVG